MFEVSEQIEIEAPLSEVFAYMDQPKNQLEITPSLARSEPLEELDNGGKRVAYTYAMAGVELDGEIRAIDYRPEEHVHWEMSGDLTGEIEWQFAGDEPTTVTYVGRYDIPVPVVNAVVEPFAKRYNKRELRTTLENLKTRLEGAEGG